MMSSFTTLEVSRLSVTQGITLTHPLVQCHHSITFLRPTQYIDRDTRYRITVQVNDGSGRGFEDIEVVCSWCIYTVSCEYFYLLQTCAYKDNGTVLSY